MAIIMGDLREALIEAATQDSRIAAIELNTANMDKRLTVIESKVGSLMTSAAVVGALLTVAEGMLATLVFKAFK